jgi:hypothetical protein
MVSNYGSFLLLMDKKDEIMHGRGTLTPLVWQSVMGDREGELELS